MRRFARSPILLPLLAALLLAGLQQGAVSRALAPAGPHVPLPVGEAGAHTQPAGLPVSATPLASPEVLASGPGGEYSQPAAAASQGTTRHLTPASTARPEHQQDVPLRHLLCVYRL